MNSRGKRFEVDRANGKLLGVCAGLANRTGVDATVFRIAIVLFAVLITPWIAAAYGVAYWIGRSRAQTAYAQPRAVSGEDSRERMRSLDLRMQAIETYVTSSNSRLAREIEDLR